MPITDAYNAPVKDMKFVLHELWDASELSTYEGYEDASPDLIDAMLEEAGKFMKNELLPLNQSGDREGCTLENGVVRTPKGFKEAYDKYCENGFTALSTDPKYGGTGLPHTVEFMVQEMVVSTNMAFGMYPGLSHGCYNAIYLHGSEEQKDQYLPKLNTGEWSGTMCLTEPHCGTDLGLIKTKAEPKGDGIFALTGQKIFISAGEHDLTENIVHLVLAKLPDAPEGVRATGHSRRSSASSASFCAAASRSFISLVRCASVVRWLRPWLKSVSDVCAACLAADASASVASRDCAPIVSMVVALFSWILNATDRFQCAHVCMLSTHNAHEMVCSIWCVMM